MVEPTIKGMNRGKFIALVEETLSKIGEINRIHQKLTAIESQVDQQHADVGDSLNKVQEIRDQSTTMLDGIEDVYKKVLKGDGDSGSIEQEINTLRDNWKKSDEEVEDIKNKFLGCVIRNDIGDDVELPGYLHQIKKELDDYQERYDSLYTRIETELLSGATTVSLSQAFNEKSSEYKKERKRWQGGLVFLLASAMVYLGSNYYLTPELKGVDWLISFIPQLPFFTVFIWLVIFTGNRRAENKKLEESYKHKEVMAKSYTGYKKYIEELDVEDKALLRKHMENLVNAIAKDASSFLTSKGESHPFVDMLNKQKQKNESDFK